MEQEARRHGIGADLISALPEDLISALPEDLLLLVLVRLPCTRAAARTSLLSRRWRGLWTRLPDLTFRDVAIPSIQVALSPLHGAVRPGLSLLDIAFSSFHAAAGASLRHSSVYRERHQVAAAIPPLLHAAAELSPVELHMSIPSLGLEPVGMDLSPFHRATSIQLYAPNLRLTLPRASDGLHALESLSLTGCFVVDLAVLVLRCPRLRVLRVTEALLAGINIHSESLQKLFVRTNKTCSWKNVDTNCINIDTPRLKQLTLSFSTDAELSVSVVAPILEKVSWECSFSGIRRNTGVGPWGLLKLSLHAAARQRAITCTREEACLQLSNATVLSLQLSAAVCVMSYLIVPKIVQHIEKHLVTDFSVLDLTMLYENGHTTSVAHVFGPFVLDLLGSQRIRTATRRLQIHFIRPKVKGKCLVNCRCDEPRNWRSKNISLISLEEVEIEGFDGEDHEFDFLEVIFRCAPILKTMVVRTSDEVATSNSRCNKMQDIFEAYPDVKSKLLHH